MPQKTKTPSPNSMPQTNDEPLVIENFERKPFYVEGARVTPGNIDKVAQWCSGTVEIERKVVDDHGTIMEQKYIHVETHQPMNDRQKMAFIGDRVLRSDKGFKVYSERAFQNAFVADSRPKSESNGERDKPVEAEHDEGPTH